LEEDQAIVKDVLFVQIKGLEETVKELTNFVLTGAFIYTNPIMWKILNFKVKPGRS
jgi:hypothetical protein